MVAAPLLQPDCRSPTHQPSTHQPINPSTHQPINPSTHQPSTPIYLLLGSNLGDRQRTLSEAIVQLERDVGEVTARSARYETAPWGITDQPAFLNQVLCLATGLPPEDLLLATQAVERQLGRERKEKWGARTIDVDILYYNDRQIHSERLIIPHPYLPERRFTLVPLAEIAPDFVHPALGLTNRQLLERCADAGEVKRLENSQG